MVENIHYKLSIIVPVFKVEKYLSRCIDSIINQTYKDFELILVDDGSPDRCGEICDDYALKDNRIKVIHKQNGGLSSARNAGIDIAVGQYIGFVDSDDYISKDMVECLINLLIENNSDISFCKFKLVYEGEDNLTITQNIDVFNFQGSEIMNQLYTEVGRYLRVSCGKIYKKELFENLRFEMNRIHEDEFIIHRILYLCRKITFTTLEQYYYYQTENSIMRTNKYCMFKKKKLDGLYAYLDRIQFFRSINKRELQYEAEYYFIQMFFKYYFKCKYGTFLNDSELKALKMVFIKEMKIFIKNPKYRLKEKILWVLFYISDSSYELYFRRRNILLGE